MSQLFWGTTTYAQRLANTAQVVFYGTLTLLVGPVVVGFAWWLRRQVRPWWVWILAPLGLIWLLGWRRYLAAGTDELVPLLLLWWFGLLPAGPLVAVVMQGWELMARFLRPRDLQDHLEEQQAQLRAQELYLSRQAGRADTEAPQAAQALNLGLFIKGDQLSPQLGVRRLRNWIQLDEEMLDQHMLLVGATGAGKSETLKRLVVETLRVGKRDIFLVDGKGDPHLGRQIAQLIYARHGQPVPFFSLGVDHPSCVYHGFRGEPLDIYNRLAALVGVEEQTGNAMYYADRNRDLLQLVCYAPDGPPRSFEALRAQLQVEWLRDVYQGNQTELAVLDAIEPQMVADLQTRLRTYARDLAPLVGEEGFVLEESRGAVFSLRTLSVGDSARRFLDFFMEDLKDFAGKRQKRPALLIIDEFGAFQNEQIVALLTMARSAHLGVVLATQDVSSLGADEQTRQLILANTRTKLLMASDFPEKVAELAGTKLQIEASIQHDEGQATGMGSARVQHAFSVDMNEAGRLQPGEAFLIRQRHTVKLKVQPVPAVDVDPQAIAQISKQTTESSVVSREATSGKRKKPPKLDW